MIEQRNRWNRVILPRVEKAAKAIELIGNGAGRDYDRTLDDVRAVLERLQTAVDDLERRYAQALGVSSSQIAPQFEDTDVDTRPVPSAASAAFASALEAVAKMDPHRVALLAAAVDSRQVAALTTHLIGRLSEMAEARQP